MLSCSHSEDQSMKAIVTTQYGPPEVLQLREITTPPPAVNQVLIKLYASSVNPLDSFAMRGALFFLPSVGKLLKPKHKVIGADIGGRVDSVGRDVKQFHPGDDVFGASFEEKGLGGFAEYVCAMEDRLALKPTNISFEQAAAVPVAAITALQVLRDQGQIEPGQKVLIGGASGGGYICNPDCQIVRS
jgi:NADPH:quinone reductase-like Zn-dependent oxidoreductase